MRRSRRISVSLAISTIAASWATVAFAQLSPQDELKALRPAAGIDVSLFASEPMITNPSCIDVDTHGRVWVAQIEWYRDAAKNPPADKIEVLEDTDGDGKADKATTFVDGIFAPMSICVCGDRVYAFIQGNLLMWEDKDGDLKADGPAKKIVSGFARDNHDHTAHSIVVGPDHKWYMAHGDKGFKVEGLDGSKIEYQFGAMVRGELDGTKLENVAVNFRNPYEICVNSFGESFCSDNDNDGNESVRICWILEGGNYGWNGGPPFNKRDLDRRVPIGTPYREAWHFRGWIPGNVPGTLVTGFGSPTGICCYEGDAFGERFKNVPLHTDPGPRVLRAYRHVPSGAGMKATSEDWLTSEGDDYFRPDGIRAAPDGSLFVSDWYDGGVGGHHYNNPTEGRIFLVKPSGKKLARKEKPGPYNNVADAIEGLKSPNLATQFLAREKLLAEGQGAVPSLIALLQDAEPNNRARALWLLDRIGGEARQQVVSQLQSNDPVFRALAVRILRRHGDEFADAILPLASDSNGEVRREVILACGTISGEKAIKTLAKLAATYDGSDRYLLEAINVAARKNKAKVFAELKASSKVSLNMLPLVQLLDAKTAAEMITSRLSTKPGLDTAQIKLMLDAAGNVSSVEMGRSVLAFVTDASANVEMRKLALSKVFANLGDNWDTLAKDQETLGLFKTLLRDATLRPMMLGGVGSLGLSQLTGDVAAVASAPGVEPAAREQAIRVLVDLNGEEAAKTIRTLLADSDAAVRQAALNAIVDLQDVKTLREVLTSEPYSLETRRDAATRLLDSSGGALVLLQLVKANELTPDLKQEVVRVVTHHPDTNVRLLFEEFIPEAQRPKKLGAVIKAEEILALKGDAGQGEKIFRQSAAAQCKSCHVVHGVGGNIGPDLSTIGTKYERAALLETILEPSKAISHEYRQYVIETVRGQVFNGIVESRSKKVLMLKDVKGKLMRIPAKDIESLREMPKSLMPELVLQDISAQDAADLLAYLTTLKQKTNVVGSAR